MFLNEKSAKICQTSEKPTNIKIYAKFNWKHFVAVSWNKYLYNLVLKFT